MTETHALLDEISTIYIYIYILIWFTLKEYFEKQ